MSYKLILLFTCIVIQKGIIEASIPAKTERKTHKKNVHYKTSGALDKCPEGATGQFPYSGNCSMFLNCWKGRGEPQQCAPGTLFNPNELKCDFPERVKCVTGTINLSCYHCMGGPKTGCAKVDALTPGRPCSGKNAQCYEALINYQNGAMPIVQRRCWIPPENATTTDFCKWFKNPVGKLGKCITCKKDLCNTDENFW